MAILRLMCVLKLNVVAGKYDRLMGVVLTQCLDAVNGLAAQRRGASGEEA